MKCLNYLRLKVSTRAIIIAGGESTRWGNYLGVPKHLVKVNGEPILHRTVRLLKEQGIKDIYIVARSSRYQVNGTSIYRPKITPEWSDADSFLSSRELWNKEGRTIVLLGDVYFTEEAMKTIVSLKWREWRLFCRAEASEITGCLYGECFAWSFWPEHLAEHEAALWRIVKLFKEGKINRNNGWEHYRAMIGRPDDKVRKPHIMEGRYNEINDFTEDFDYPEDYREFMKRFKEANKL